MRAGGRKFGLPALIDPWSRASRREFAIVLVSTIGLSFVGWIVAYALQLSHAWTPYLVGFNLILDLVLLVLFIRRLHDMGKSGWYLALWIVPMAGLVLLAWCFARPGATIPNRFTGPQTGLGSSKRTA